MSEACSKLGVFGRDLGETGVAKTAAVAPSEELAADRNEHAPDTKTLFEIETLVIKTIFHFPSKYENQPRKSGVSESLTNLGTGLQKPRQQRQAPTQCACISRQN
ncbi:hypothetical protein [Roseovarius sp. 2305UL8-3]|uniref:hypothetical protein n=1 Tax=Roseovarius conchicola TaxID=3121636 RepID=UPI0035285294